MLLGPESYARFTNCARAFESLKVLPSFFRLLIHSLIQTQATFTIIEQLSTETVKEHLETLKAVTPEEREAEAKRISDVTWMQNPNFEGDAEEDDEDDGEEVEVEEDNEADE